MMEIKLENEKEIIESGGDVSVHHLSVSVTIKVFTESRPYFACHCNVSIQLPSHRRNVF